MRTARVLNVLLGIFLINITCVQSGTECLIPITDRDYSNDGYFRYCKNNGVMTRQRGGDSISCANRDKLKLLNFQAYVPKDPNQSKCKRINRFHYRMKEDTGCLPSSQRDDIAFPFIAALSGKTAARVKNSNSGNEIQTGQYQYKQISLEVGCETESSLKIDMCKPGTRVFPENANVSLYFDPNTAMANVNKNHSGCYCYFKTFNTTVRRILARAYDIRLHRQSQLFLDSAMLSPSHTYWWQTGLLSSSLAILKLTGLTAYNVPDSIWLDIYGRNLNITCDNKPLVIKGLVTSAPQNFANSSSGGLGTVYIAIIVIVGIVFFIIIILLIKVFRSRVSNASKSGAYKVDDPYASETFISSTYERGDDPPSPRDSVVVYNKGDNKTAVYSQSRKCRKNGESDECHLYNGFDSDPEQEDTLNNSVIHSDHKFSHDALVHERPKQHPPVPPKPPKPTRAGDDINSIYNHFNDHPDVIPTSPTSPTNNIYNTSATGVYSSFLPARQKSKQENVYDLS